MEAPAHRILRSKPDADKGDLFCGTSLHDLSAEELRKIVKIYWALEQKLLAEKSRERDFLFGLRRAS